MYVKYINQNHDTNIVWNGFANRVNSNNLPLTLVLIKHKPDTHQSSVSIMFLLSKVLHKWFNNIIWCWISAYFSNEMKASKYMNLDRWWDLGSLSYVITPFILK